MEQLSDPMGVVEIAGLMLGSSVLASVVTALLRKKTDVFSVMSAAYEKLGTRVTALETKLADVEKQLGDERTEHARSRDLLRIALRHIRDIVAWGSSDRSTPLPDPPKELLDQEVV